MKQKYSATADKLGLTFSTGTLARQAGGAVTVTCGETTVFVSATAAQQPNPDQGVFPLTVDYREKFSAAGRFPGGYFKREGRPTEKEILTSRLCDRPIRPLFPKGFMNEVQIIGLLLSTDRTHEADVLMVNGASAALLCSDIPWDGPIGCVRVGEIEGKFVCNSTHEQIFEGKLDLVYVGNEKEMLMIEGSADEMPEARFIEALTFAHQAIQESIAAQKKLAADAPKPKFKFDPILPDPEVIATCQRTVGDRFEAIFFETDRQKKNAVLDAVKQECIIALENGEVSFDKQSFSLAFETLQKTLYRKQILEHGKRAQNRGLEEVRPIYSEVGLLKRVHGSALFQRGDTQTLVTTTLGTPQDIQDMDGLTGGAHKKSFILHYNFPPYSMGETGRFGFTSRREIGHGALAERSLMTVLPSEEDFPYAIRVVSEIMESNGSTSMASVCGGSLSLMDAGVPLTAPVAGTSIGLITRLDSTGNIEAHCLLTDILGEEDHLGDMDFKICGTRNGITGFQLDLKLQGLPFEIVKAAIHRGQKTRNYILSIMEKTLPESRKEISVYAPRIDSIQINLKKIGALIGPGGRNIKRIIEISGADIDIKEDNSGKVLIYARSKESMERCIEEIQTATKEIRVGEIYKGTVTKAVRFGAFVEVAPGQEGLVPISELADFYVEQTEDICKVGDSIVVKCIGIDNQGRIRLSRKATLESGDSKERRRRFRKPEERPPRSFDRHSLPKKDN